MISHVEGILDNIEGNRIVVDVSGVGYGIDVPSSFFSRHPKIGQRIKVFTVQVVREDDISLYGFSAKEERSLFTTLLTVNGVGPKGAMAIISGIPLDKLVAAITKGNVDIITAVKGVGLKTAQKIVIDLKEKIGKAYAIEPSKGIPGLGAEDPLLKDAVTGLMTLGLSPAEARDAIDRAGIDFSAKPGIEDIIKKALKSLA